MSFSKSIWVFFLFFQIIKICLSFTKFQILHIHHHGVGCFFWWFGFIHSFILTLPVLLILLYWLSDSSDGTLIPGSCSELRGATGATSLVGAGESWIWSASATIHFRSDTINSNHFMILKTPDTGYTHSLDFSHYR